jgi:hypothetical protein
MANANDASFLDAFPPEIQEITLTLREVAATEMPGARETIFTQSFNFSPDGEYRHRICYIWPGKTHATMGFFFGTSLDDPESLLEGTGKRMRHVKVKSVETARSPAVAALARQAWSIAPACLSNLKRK